MFYSRIAGTGSYLPEKILTNQALESKVQTNDEWIYSRTGIKQRHVAAEGQLTSDLAFEAASRALEAAHCTAADVDLIIVATTTPDMVFPSCACILQHKLGATRAAAFDLQAVCSGFIYALSTADQFIRSGNFRKILVVGAEILTRLIDWSDRSTCVLFGDGAGAVLLEQSTLPGILSSHLHADGSYAPILSVPGNLRNGLYEGGAYLQMEGNAVFKFAVKVLGEVSEEALSANHLDKSALDWLIPHQANIRIIQATAKKLNLPMDKVICTVDLHANTSAASIPLALDCAVRDGRVKKGQLVLLEGVGGGFTWGGVLVRM
jgi:3-oxoacyl-[acyl-carrier-protein] synthase-3